MHNHTFRLIDVAAIVEAKTGKTIADGDADGRYDAEVVILHDAQLFDIKDNGAPANTVYFGDLVISAFDSSVSIIGLSVNGVSTVSVICPDQLKPSGNIYPSVIFNSIPDYSSIVCYFYGWKITLNP